MYKNAVVWFRNDLRLHDNEALHSALNQAEYVYPFFCFDSENYSFTDYGFLKTGTFRFKFILQTVEDLKNSLINIGSNLAINSGNTVTLLSEFVEKVEAESVFFHSERETSQEHRLEKSVTSTLKLNGVKSHSFLKATLLHYKDLPFKVADTPKIFTSFKKEVERNFNVRTLLPTPQKISSPKFSKINLETISDIERKFVNRFETNSFKSNTVLLGGESNGLKRLNDYIWKYDHLKSYKQTRNGLLGLDYSSKFSPWLANGSLSPRKVYFSVKDYENKRIKNDSTYWMVFELLWRDFFRFTCRKHGNSIFKLTGIRDLKLDWNYNKSYFDSWIKGMTGYPLVDANMREISNTGFMSNRGRQNVASFLTKNLYHDWRKGAEWFESLLIDYDPCSNWGNWNYLAGVGNDARDFRFFNILTQSQRYDSNGEYIKHWLPELKNINSEHIHAPWKFEDQIRNYSGLTLGVDYPKPIVDFKSSIEKSRKSYYKSLDYQK